VIFPTIRFQKFYSPGAWNVIAVHAPRNSRVRFSFFKPRAMKRGCGKYFLDTSSPPGGYASSESVNARAYPNAFGIAAGLPPTI
jgi:hypothetical protein